MTYGPPLTQFLSMEWSWRRTDWPDYTAMGFTYEHVPDLIRMATDKELLRADQEGDIVWAPMHAWRTLGQLGAEEAIEPLIDLLRYCDDEHDDWIISEAPGVLSMMGAKALPYLVKFLENAENGHYARIVVIDTLEKLAAQHPETREDVVSVLIANMARHEENDPELNGFLLSAFLNLNAVEAAPVIEEAFAMGHVDTMIAGDWEDAQIDLGLLDKRITKRKPHGWSRSRSAQKSLSGTSTESKKPQKAKKQKKSQKAARKKNRKKK